MLIDKKPKNLSVKDATEILKNIFQDKTEIFKKLKIDIEETEGQYIAIVRRSKNDPWDRSWTKNLNILFPETFTNGWKYPVSQNKENPFQKFCETAVSSLEEEPAKALIPDMSQYETERRTQIIEEEPEAERTKPDPEHVPVIQTSVPKKRTSIFYDANDPRLDEYRKQGFDENQVEQIGMGLAKGLNVSSYAKKEIPWISMMSHRLYLLRQ